MAAIPSAGPTASIVNAGPQPNRLETSTASQIDAPVLGATYGISNRAQLSATVPFYRFSYDGSSQSGLDNVYVSTKIGIVDPRDGRFGLAVGAWESSCVPDSCTVRRAAFPHNCGPICLGYHKERGVSWPNNHLPSLSVGCSSIPRPCCHSLRYRWAKAPNCVDVSTDRRS